MTCPTCGLDKYETLCPSAYHTQNDIPCTCGSGAHPRRCTAHPARYEAHCNELSLESAQERVEELEAVLRTFVNIARTDKFGYITCWHCGAHIDDEHGEELDELDDVTDELYARADHRRNCLGAVALKVLTS